MPSDAERMLAKVRTGPSCHEWQAGRGSHGYGHFWMDGRNVTAQRAAWLIFVGPIPDGLTVDHRCRNPLCVRLDHLRLLPNDENARDNRQAQRNNSRWVPGDTATLRRAS